MEAFAMKFVLFPALLASTYSFEIGKQNDGASSCNPVTINVQGNIDMKGCHKPSAHIEAAKKQAITYPKGHVIKDWSVSAPYSHLAGGMMYNDGKLTVPTPGRYYIYAQFYYHSTGRIHIRVNNNVVTMIQSPSAGGSHGTMSTGGVFNLKAGDAISLDVYSGYVPITVYMDAVHSYFGAFLI
ncbi:uncharacterized protein LOC144636854 [Oculina patagonica]